MPLAVPEDRKLGVVVWTGGRVLGRGFFRKLPVAVSLQGLPSVFLSGKVWIVLQDQWRLSGIASFP
ncbi:hypothetical protein [Microbacterium paraoxydans]|uniref:hypothetical protein n=1 Tax=Microbacterium paraoxydans TaxID=199592 RepID=UPI0021A5D294|nr:hypothetical protein [Microbacterium paraoxydans]MCT2222546.1 hypothetical protein [Microbacterium paraoxydans]